MDIVITYVDGLDPEWQDSYAAAVGGKALVKRYRDWGTLRYLLRGIERNLPFVEKVHLVVASDSQVPDWVDRGTVDVVRHSDFIPQEFLPVFNSPSIEMYLHRIPGLAEQYLYFNDDFFPMLPCSEDDFFKDGRPAVRMTSCRWCIGEFRRCTRRSDALARAKAGVVSDGTYMRPQHTAAAMSRSVCEELFCAAEGEIRASMSLLRSESNYNQYLYTDYMYHTGRTACADVSNRHFSLAAAPVRRIAAFIRNPETKLVCINDVQMSQKKFDASRAELLKAFGEAFPDKSRFEV